MRGLLGSCTTHVLQVYHSWGRRPEGNGVPFLLHSGALRR